MRKKCSVFLIMVLALLLAACGKEKATVLRLMRTTGTVSVRDGKEKELAPEENMGLYGGYHTSTELSSHAWITLDEGRLAKLDEDSEVGIEQSGRKLELVLEEGSLFFDIVRPLEEDEEFNIRTSNMTVGIRGTCGWVSVPEQGGHLYLHLLEGSVVCRVTLPDGSTVYEVITAGQMADLDPDGDIGVMDFSAEDIPDFVLEEIRNREEFVEMLTHSEEPPEESAEEYMERSESSGQVENEEDLLAPYREDLEAMPASDGISPGFLYAGLLDFEGDGEPEILVITVDEERKSDHAVSVTLSVYREKIEQDAIVANCHVKLAAGESVSLVTCEGRLFMDIYNDMGYGDSSHIYFGPSIHAEDGWYWNWLEEVMALPESGMYQRTGLNGGMEDCSKEEYEAIVSKYMQVRELVYSEDGVHAICPAE